LQARKRRQFAGVDLNNQDYNGGGGGNQDQYTEWPGAGYGR
jgi:hypothetical protein